MFYECSLFVPVSRHFLKVHFRSYSITYIELEIILILICWNDKFYFTQQSKQTKLWITITVHNHMLGPQINWVLYLLKYHSLLILHFDNQFYFIVVFHLENVSYRKCHSQVSNCIFSIFVSGLVINFFGIFIIIILDSLSFKWFTNVMSILGLWTVTDYFC
jgi:hypothetical protein